MKRTLRLLDAVKARLDAQRPFPAAVTKNLHENLVLNWTYHSNAIEGNGRTARLLMNLELLKAGYPAAKNVFEKISSSSRYIANSDYKS